MKNFPSTLIKQESTRDNLGDNIKTAVKNLGNKLISNIFGSSGGTSSPEELQRELADGLDRRYLDNQLDEIDILSVSIDGGIPEVGLWANSTRGQKSSGPENVKFEDPFRFSSDFYETINNYRFLYKGATKAVLDHGLEPVGGAEGKEAFAIMETATAPSLFNPFNTVKVTGMIENIPLVNKNAKDGEGLDVEIINNMPGATDGEADPEGKLGQKFKVALNTNLASEKDTSDCSIRKLVELSKGQKPQLGLATYRYIDFMYCKDLGKIPNNRLITLRKFPTPVGDNIFKEANPHQVNNDQQNRFFSAFPDIGRLITWFDNEDNKLEDICKYQYNATWKEFTAEIDQRPSEQKDDKLLDKLANAFSPQNNKLVSTGYIGHTTALGWAAQKLHIPIFQNDPNNKDGYNWDTLRNYDQHRIYEPPNRIWETHKYEGRLKFSQDINLTFRYKLRSYDNINPKSAFLDLLGNIMVVTYRRGSFWGGENQIYGPSGNNSIYAKGHALVDKAFDKLGGIWHSFAAGGTDALDMITGWMSNAVQEASNTLKEITTTGKSEKGEKAINKAKEEGQKLVGGKEWNWTNILKGMVKNQLGRPAIYAFNSLLTGENVGPWHLTIGNPRNPIMSIGNLILIDSQVWHSGPLGLDDFPTELNVKVTLKHAKGRDSVDIQKMYTKGNGAIYNPMNLTNFFEFRDEFNTYAFSDLAGFKPEGNTLKMLLSTV